MGLRELNTYIWQCERCSFSTLPVQDFSPPILPTGWERMKLEVAGGAYKSLAICPRCQAHIRKEKPSVDE